MEIGSGALGSFVVDIAAKRAPALCVCALLVILASGCVSPVGVERVDANALHRSLSRNVISTGELSDSTMITLRRHDLERLLNADPARAIAELRAVAVAEPSGELLLALSEVSFRHGFDYADPAYARAAAIYAYAYLFPEDATDRPSPFSPNFRLACNLYNRGLTLGFSGNDGLTVVFQTATYTLPFGRLEIHFDESQRRWGERTLANFAPVAEIEVRGLTNRYRRPGIGAPLAASAPISEAEADIRGFLPGRVAVPSNLLLRIDDPRTQVLGDTVRGVLELRTLLDAETVELEGQTVPLEFETSSSLAYMLEGDPVWETEFRNFFIGDLTREETRLRALQPYLPGRTPVVLVHGTASSSVRWANMLNELGNDPRIHNNYQFWFYDYDTGNPVGYSAALLREELEQAQRRFDPRGSDPAMQKMVLIGHSQGGMLVKMMAIDPGDTLWDLISRVPIDELKLSPETRELLTDVFFVKPLPFVRRVIFIATPHRGSFVAGNRIAHWLTRLMRLPARVTRAVIDFNSDNSEALRTQAIGRTPSSVDNMTPGNPFVVGLSKTPIDSAITAHSIIAVKGDGPAESGNDGVVEYQSAHIDEAESEVVVRWHHSVQDHPDAIEEVRRILLLQIETD